jgi:hypothetical protein
MFNIKDFVQKTPKHTRYRRQIERITAKNGYTENIEKAVNDSILNIDSDCRSFVVYGEPQSGKTEMMIALTARLLDHGFKIVVILLNDNVQLLTQNLERFRRSSIDPAPKNYTEIIDPVISIGDREWIIFSKKNAGDLKKLIEKIGHYTNKVIIDDEADYATPNAKINKGEKTKINELVQELIGDDGIYIGVTATPARLDLNNTFRNENEKWVDFPTHPYYKGQSTFFPTAIDSGKTIDFRLNLLPDTDDTPKYLRDALFSFLINVAYLNSKINVHDGEQNYSMLVHTSGKKADHSKDHEEIVKAFDFLAKDDPNDDKFKKYYEDIFKIAEERYPGQGHSITQYIYQNRSRSTIIVMNSDADRKTVDYTSATNPATLFTVAIGGNIVSRGVTFDNLLSMFFTRDVKHKIQQDTYIQRARMFGSRGKYLPFFELHIPEQLYLDWHKCFVFHKLSLDSIRSGNGSPVWLEDSRVSAAASSSVDKTTVSFDSGEMSFEIFNYDYQVENIISDTSKSDLQKIGLLAKVLGIGKVPDFIMEWIRHFSPDGEDSVLLHKSSLVSDGYKSADVENLKRAKGFMSSTELNREKKDKPTAIHHFKIFHNSKAKARLFYKFDGNIKFIKNLKQNFYDKGI